MNCEPANGIWFVIEELMKVDVVIVYKGALAYYSVLRERADVYSAYLKKYDGPAAPAKALTLVKSIRHWTGSSDDADLLYELGRAIDRHQSLDPLFPFRNDDKNIMDSLG